MNNSETEPAQRGWFKRLIQNPWLLLVLKLVAFVLLIAKVIPTGWLETQWPFLLLVSMALIGLLISNYRLTSRLIAEVEFKESEIRRVTHSLERNARYADIIPMLNIAFQQLHNAIRRDHANKLMYHEYFESCCQSLEKVFSKVTGVDCHVCIKMTSFPNDQIPSPTKAEKRVTNLQVRTYCRSLHLSNKRIQIDHQEVSHLITENTDFEDIFMKKGECFFCNDLAEKDEYKNSSVKLKNHGSYVVFPKGTPLDHKRDNWPLPYRATIVAPIVPIVKETSEERIILGLLCVDSKEPNVFNEELDTHIMTGCADGIYNSFKKLFQPYNPTVKTKP